MVTATTVANLERGESMTATNFTRHLTRRPRPAGAYNDNVGEMLDGVFGTINLSNSGLPSSRASVEPW